MSQEDAEFVLITVTALMDSANATSALYFMKDSALKVCCGERL